MTTPLMEEDDDPECPSSARRGPEFPARVGVDEDASLLIVGHYVVGRLN